jgi:capsular polysaccharide biosynthesis protein
VLQTLGSDESYGSSEAFSADHVQSLSFGHYIDILRRRFVYFLVPFAVVSIPSLYLIANFLKPIYLSEGKILVESQVIAPDFPGPLVAAASSERILRIQQRVMTRDNLLSIANKFGLFPGRSGVLDLMRDSSQIKPVEVVGLPRMQNTPAITFTVGFEYENPELAMRVASEFVSLIVQEDARLRTSRSTEAVRILANETKDIEDKLEATQTQISEIARRPREDVPEIPEQEKAQLTALAALKAELIQKTSVYSNAHPAVTALKKRIVEMEKTLTQQAPAKALSTQADEIEAAKRQREALEKRLDEANSKLATARLNEKLDRDQKSERLQILESPSLPQNPLKSNRIKFVGMAFAAAAALGIGTLIAAELFDGSIRGRDQLLGVVASPLIVSIPYITTRADVIRARWRVILGAVSVVTLLAVLGGLATAIVLRLPVDGS